MHVAYIHQHFSTKKGATGTRSYEMSRRLIDAGHSVTMICGAYDAAGQTREKSARVSQNAIDGIRVLQINEPYGNRMGFARRVMAFGRFAATATRVVSQLNVDLVFATSTPLTVGIPGMNGARKLGVPFVFEVRDLWPELAIALGVVKNPLIKWYTRRLERNIYGAAMRIIALAPGIRDGIAKTGYPVERISLVPNCSDLDLFQPDDTAIDDDRFGAQDDFRLVFTGAHGLANGLEAVLDAAAELKRRNVKGVRFVFIGQGRMKFELRARSERMELGDSVSWIDPMPKEDLARVLPRMDAGLMILKNLPSFYYGTSPNKFFDYIAAGLPVLNNYPGWLAGMIDEHKCGLVVQPDDAKAFADAVVQLRSDRDLCERMGQAGRKLAEAKFSRDMLGCAFVEVLEGAHAEFLAKKKKLVPA